MPKKLERCVKKVKKQPGKSESDAYAICTASLKKGKKEEMKESNQSQYITNFIHNICNKDFSEASKTLQAVVDEKIKQRISNVMEKR